MGSNFFSNLKAKDVKLKLLNFTFILFFISLLDRLIEGLFINHGYYSSLTSEFLINYQAGFVRRGLSGELLLFFVRHVNVNLEWLIKGSCLIWFLLVCLFFVRAFIKKGYSLYILPLCFFLGGNIVPVFWIRKDYLFLCFFISILWVFGRKKMNNFLKLLIINVLMVLVILSHEVFAFFAFPVLFLMIFFQYKRFGVLKAFIISNVSLLPAYVAFLSAIYFKGDAQIAYVIWNSWSDYIGDDISKIGKSVSALGWPSIGTFKFHFVGNFLSVDQQIFSLVVWLITFPVIYYISTNALYTFRRNKQIFTLRDKTLLSAILVFQLVCLAPVFLVLSCDYVRVIFYWISSSFAVFFISSKISIRAIISGLVYAYN